MTHTLDDSLRWTKQGTAFFRDALARLGPTDEALTQPSALPGWTRKHLVAHVAANAAALSNLVNWASTGVERPMYTSTDQRNADIEQGATRPADELLARFDETAAALDAGWAGLTEAQWQHEVRTAQGRTVPASETPWMRAREVLVHVVDLGTGTSFDDLPADFLSALVSEITTKRSSGGSPALQIAPTDTDQRWQVTGDGDEVVIVGPLAQVTAWLAGRTFSGVTTEAGEGAPVLPAWL